MKDCSPLLVVITGLVPVIHALFCLRWNAWMAGTRPAMTIYEGVNLQAYLVCFNPELNRTAVGRAR
jgi:hypothetical protein